MATCDCNPQGRAFIAIRMVHACPGLEQEGADPAVTLEGGNAERASVCATGPFSTGIRHT